MTDDGTGTRQTMSMNDAAARVGISVLTVQRWFDAAEQAGSPVGECDRDARGMKIPGSHRRPYVDAVEEWRRRRKGLGLAAPVSPAAT